MGATTTTLMSFEEFERLPDEPGKFELLKGELTRMPPAKRTHTEVAERLYRRLYELVEAIRTADPNCQLGSAHHEMGYRVARHPDSWLQPDVSITHAAQPKRDYLEGAPALAVEIISESNTVEQMDDKIDEYLAHGAREVWILHPKKRHVWTYKEDRLATKHTGQITTGLLPGASIDLDALF